MSRSLNLLGRVYSQSSWLASKPLPTSYFSCLRQQGTRPATDSIRHAISSLPVRLVSYEPLLSRFVQDRARYATHRSGRLRPVNPRNGGFGSSGNGGSGSSGNGGYGSSGNGGGGKRSFLEQLPNSAVIWGILGVNGLVYLAWQRASYDYQTMRDPSLHLWLRDNFTTSLRNLREGRIWTLVTSAFSHEGTGHIFVNALTFFFMAPPVLGVLGKRAFFVLYLGGGLVSSLTSLWFNNFYKPKPNYSSHGASGAMYAVISLLACIAPKATFQLYGIIPVPAWLCVSGLFLYDAYSAMNNKQAGTDTAGHVGGVLGGILYYLALRFRRF